MLEMLAPLDYPRQSLANLGRGAGRLFSGEADLGDLLRAVPGAGGVLAGALFGMPAGALAGGALQGLGQLVSPETFEAPMPGHLVEALGGDPESMLQTMGMQLATDPLMYLGMGQGAKLAGGLAARRPPMAGATMMPALAPETAPLGMAMADAPRMPPAPVRPAMQPPAFGTPQYDAAVQGAIGADAAAQAAAEERAAIMAQPMVAGQSPGSPLAQMLDPAAQELSDLRGLYGVHADMMEDLKAGLMRPDAESLASRVRLMDEIGAGETGFQDTFGKYQLTPGMTAQDMDAAADAARAEGLRLRGMTPGERTALSDMHDQASALRSLIDPLAEGSFERPMVLGVNTPEAANPLLEQLTNIADRAEAALGDVGHGGLRIPTSHLLQGRLPPPELVSTLDRLEAAGLPINREAVIDAYRAGLREELSGDLDSLYNRFAGRWMEDFGLPSADISGGGAEANLRAILGDTLADDVLRQVQEVGRPNLSHLRNTQGLVHPGTGEVQSVLDSLPPGVLGDLDTARARTINPILQELLGELLRGVR